MELLRLFLENLKIKNGDLCNYYWLPITNKWDLDPNRIKAIKHNIKKPIPG